MSKRAQVLRRGFVAFPVALTIVLWGQFASAQCVYPPSGLVSWWSGEGNNADDLMGSHPGILADGVTFVPGKVGQAFNFDGVSSYVRLPDNSFPFPAAGNDNAPFTFELWFATTNSGVILGQTMADPFQATSSHVPAIYVGGGGKLRVQMFWDGTVNQLTSAADVNDGVFHHLAVTYDGTNETVFLDAALVGTKVFSQLGYATTYHYQLGTGYTGARWTGGNNGWFNFKGQLDEAALYNRALTSNEIRTLYNAGADGKCKPASPAGILYGNGFEGAVGSEWSSGLTASTPRGGRRFLGQFGNQTITLTLSNLPAHTNLTLGFDLFLINTWDGSAEPGPDLFDLSVEGGPTLLHASFSNTSDKPQSFPAAHRSKDWPGLTGALESNTLDYNPDCVQRLVFTFPHTLDRLQVHFQASGLQGLADESWGLDNVFLYAGGPAITLLQPVTGSEFTTPTNLVLSATVVPGLANIRTVQFLANHVLLGTVTNPPFTFIWTNPAAGVSVLTGRATDESGLSAVSQAAITVNGLAAEYFNNTNLTGAALLSRREPVINFDWSTGQAASGVPAERFASKWTGQLVPKYAESYTFFAKADDGVRLWLDGRRIIDEWRAQAESTFSNTVTLQANRVYSLQMNYYENAGRASTSLEWQSASQGRQVIPASQFFPPVPGRNRPPNIPVVSQPAEDGWVVNPLAGLPMRADFFSDPDTGQTQSAADWQIWTVSPSNLVWVAEGATGTRMLTNGLSNGSFVGTHAGLSRLLFHTDYRLRVRHRDNSGAANDWSEWAERFFNTRPPGIVGPPYVLPPNTSNVVVFGDTIALGVTATNIEPVVTYQWQLGGTPIPSATNAILSLTNFNANLAGEYTVVVSNLAGSNVTPGLSLSGVWLQLCGRVWEDRNADGSFGTSLIRGAQPDIVFVVDRSHSTVLESFLGEPIGDVNGDGILNSRLDGELAAFIALNKALIREGYTTNSRVGVVTFGNNATNLDLDPVSPGLQWAVAPNADANHNGTNDLEELLRSVRTNSVAGTDFHLALAAAANTFLQLGTTNNGNLIFISDGESDREGLLYTNDVAALNNAGIYLRAFGAGSSAVQFLSYLQLIDPNAEVFTTPEQLVEFFGGPTGSLLEPEHGLGGVTLYLDANNNGHNDPGEPVVVSSQDDPLTKDFDEAGQYCFDTLTAGSYIVRELALPGFSTTSPPNGLFVGLVHVPLVSGLNFGLARQAQLGLSLSPAGEAVLSLVHTGGVNHRIEVSSDLQHWGTLTNLSGASPLLWTDPAGATSSQRFYRAAQR